jgi:anti-sigma B factor antagonist
VNDRVQDESLEAPFDLSLSTDDGVARILISGEFDMAATDEAVDALDTALSNGTRTLVIDLSRTTFVDSTALHFLVRATAEGRDRGIGVVVVQSAPLRRLVDIVHLQGVLTLADPPGE